MNELINSCALQRELQMDLDRRLHYLAMSQDRTFKLWKSP